MDRKRLSPTAEKLLAAAGKYKYAAAVAVLGALLMLLPLGGTREKQTAQPAAESRGAVQSEMERALAAFDDVGRLRLVLTDDPATGRWLGALVVCEGGDGAPVRLHLTQAVSALTGLGADQIAIVKGRP